jgi:FMN phosphatase YigB (HAD superfamily)
VCWPHIVAEAFAEWGQLPTESRAAFPGAVMAVVRTLNLDRDAVPFLKECLRRQLTLGIASNAQEYTLGELDARLRPEGLALDVFSPQLIFWSFQHGFSKPNPHVFQIMTSRLANLGVRPSEVLMIGDRADNDIGPAAAFGWQTWQLPSEHEAGDGGWPRLQEKLWNSNHFDL